MGLARQAEHARDGRAGDVRIQNGAVFALPGKGYRQQGCDQRFAHAALAADNAYNLANAALRVRFDAKIRLRLLPLAALVALLAAGTALMIAITHGSLSSRNGLLSEAFFQANGLCLIFYY
jgi:hypothetical protein